MYKFTKRDVENDYPSILEAVKHFRVFSIEPVDGGFMVGEECDGNFGIRLSREHLLALADEIRALANNSDQTAGSQPTNESITNKRKHNQQMNTNELPTPENKRLVSSDLLGSVVRPDTFNEGWNAALHALRELCDDRMGGFRGYSWDSGAGSSGYDEAMREVIKWAESVKQSSDLPNDLDQTRGGQRPA